MYSRVVDKETKLSRREQLIMLEIGKDRIDTASSFVDYMEENYGFSKSSIWYCLNRLKEHSLVEFAHRNEQGKPLCLTKTGITKLGRLEQSRNELVTQFSSTFLNRMSSSGSYGGYAENSYAIRFR